MEGIMPANVPACHFYTGERVPCIGMGTFGNDRFSAKQVSEAVSGAIRAGYRLFDCAAAYGNEALIGEVFREAFVSKVVKREELFIMTKVWNDMHRNVEEACKKSIRDLQCEYVDLYYIHWPFPNYHALGARGDSRNPDSKPFCVDEFMDTWRQCEALVEKGLVRHIGMSNMTVKKLESVLPLCKIQPAACEMEMHPCFQQTELFDYLKAHKIQPVAYMPLGSPCRPDRDTAPGDVADLELPQMRKIAEKYGVHPAIIALKWSVQRGAIPIPFSIHEKEYMANLKCTMEAPLSDEEMETIRGLERGNRLARGQVFLWPGADDWHELWDEKERKEEL